MHLANRAARSAAALTASMLPFRDLVPNVNYSVALEPREGKFRGRQHLHQVKRKLVKTRTSLGRLEFWGSGNRSPGYNNDAPIPIKVARLVEGRLRCDLLCQT